ncbi:hypothetical protein [Dactylosporangium sp. NPDC051541]|uniref:hypothetical protein n=1 Tax=Dactylosporangium sp. NPDC051541 TaxID=3363977 RepID=UPI003795A38E
MSELGIITRTILPATAPYDFHCTLRALKDFWPGRGDIALDLRGGWARRALPHPSDPDAAIVVQITERDDGAPGVALTLFSAEPLDGLDLDVARGRVAAWLGLDDDRTEFLRLVADDPPVRALLAATTGLHMVRFPTLAEGVVYYALVQNSAPWYAAKIKRSLAAHVGTPVSVCGDEFLVLPELPWLAQLTPFELVPFVGGRPRADRVASIIGGVAALHEELLRTAPYGEARAALLGVRGIGEYTAHSLLLRALGRPDAVPLEHAQYMDTVRTVYAESAEPSPAELRDRYGPWIGWWDYCCRTALGWREAERKELEKARRSAAAPRRARTGPGSGRPRSAPRHTAPWSPTDPGRAADDPPAAAADRLSALSADRLSALSADWLPDVAHDGGLTGAAHVEGQAGATQVDGQAGATQVDGQAGATQVDGPAGAAHVGGPAGAAHVGGLAAAAHVGGLAAAACVGGLAAAACVGGLAAADRDGDLVSAGEEVVVG